MATSQSLPPPLPAGGSHVNVHLLDGGSFVADTIRLHSQVDNERVRLYNWAFLIRHPVSGRDILWDLGMSGEKKDYSTIVAEVFWPDLEMVGPRKTLRQQIKGCLSLDPDDIETVIFSHAHFDHCRPIAGEFPNAKALFGPGTWDYCAPGHFAEPSSQWDGRFFDPKRATEQSRELAGPWVPFGPFDEAMDFYGDGSFWIIKAPGHMPGNLCAAARLRDGQWIVLGSDCCHTREIYDGTYDFGVFILRDGAEASLHTDISAARETIRRIKVMEREYGAHVAFAHDATWMIKGDDATLMSLLSDTIKEAARDRLPLGRVA
ncbi:hypothetical protein LTR84_001306 [Exophiala bonariae]|uniref:Metallo-beta-lactamase domain-containing protein n=1 Tax=Exophiala bonariae TaxID=1690606 RepID=A0AAV9NFZ7_9EURO|nr:hypothetical protein LTR84_001306 [Exophiala bonariae]